MATAQWSNTFFRIELVAQTIRPGTGGIDNHRCVELQGATLLITLEVANNNSLNLVVIDYELAGFGVVDRGATGLNAFL